MAEPDHPRGVLQRRAKELGIFINDQKLLACPECGLTEDIDFQGRLFTYHDGGPMETAGSRSAPWMRGITSAPRVVLLYWNRMNGAEQNSDKVMREMRAE